MVSHADELTSDVGATAAVAVVLDIDPRSSETIEASGESAPNLELDLRKQAEESKVQLLM